VGIVPRRRLRYSREEIAARVKRAMEGTSIQQAILFGSYAKGTATASSDIDLAVIWDTDRRFLLRSEALLRRLYTFFHGVDLDVVVYTPSEWEMLRQSGREFMRRIAQEGVVVYERGEG
jgi:predicted nucleotidyltransferase